MIQRQTISYIYKNIHLENLDIKILSIEPPPSPHPILPIRILHRDLPVLERKDIAAIGFDRAVRACGFEEPFGDAAVAGDEMFRVVPAGIGEVLEEGLDAGADGGLAFEACAVGIGAGGGEEGAVGGHHGEDGVRVVAVPGLGEGVEKGLCDGILIGHGVLP